MIKEHAGLIKQWNDAKGFGFINGDNAGDVFFHISVLHGNRRPQIGDKVLYIPAKDNQGRLVAKHVRHTALTVDDPNIRKKPASLSVDHSDKSRKGIFQNLKIKIIVFIFLVAPLVLGVMQFRVDQTIRWIAYLYCIASPMTIYLYWLDKQRAGTNAQRIPEARLHLFELLGGWIGALIAQQLFRHKTRKLSYQFIFWLIVLLHELFWLDRVILGGVIFK